MTDRVLQNDGRAIVKWCVVVRKLCTTPSIGARIGAPTSMKISRPMCTVRHCGPSYPANLYWSLVYIGRASLYRPMPIWLFCAFILSKSLRVNISTSDNSVKLPNSRFPMLKSKTTFFVTRKSGSTTRPILPLLLFNQSVTASLLGHGVNWQALRNV